MSCGAFGEQSSETIATCGRSSIRTTCAILALVLTGGAAPASSPAAAVRAAHADCRTLPPAVAARVRYLSLYHVSDAKARREWSAVLAFWANSLSRESEVVRPIEVAPGLWRIDVADYQWDAAVWERLADIDPYFRVRLVDAAGKGVVAVAPPVVVAPVVPVVSYPSDGSARKIDVAGDADVYWWTGGRDKEGQQFAAGFYSRRLGKAVQPPAAVQSPSPPAGQQKVVPAAPVAVKSAFAPWVPTVEALALAGMTGSQAPVVRADWWLYQTAVSFERRAGYYDWLGLGKKEADFQALVGADVKLAQRLRKEQAGLVARSSVALHNRRLVRVPTLTGAYWKSEDYDRNTDVKNPLRLLDADAPYDATEQYGSLPNGLWAFWLGDGKGVRADVAPPNIAADSAARGVDRTVYAGLSCVRCHVEGVRPISDWARRVYRAPFELTSPDPDTAKRLRALYLSDLERSVKKDQTEYADALKAVNGMTPAVNAKAFADAWDWYAERDRTLSDVAGELGVREADLTAKLKARASLGIGGLDPLLAGLVQGEPLRVEHVEELWPLLNEIAGVRP